MNLDCATINNELHKSLHHKWLEVTCQELGENFFETFRLKELRSKKHNGLDTSR